MSAFMDRIVASFYRITTGRWWRSARMIRLSAAIVLAALLLPFPSQANIIGADCYDAYDNCLQHCDIGDFLCRSECADNKENCLREAGIDRFGHYTGIAYGVPANFVLSQAVTNQVLNIGLYDAAGTAQTSSGDITNVQVLAVSLQQFASSTNYVSAPWVSLGTATATAPGVWTLSIDTTGVTNPVILRAAMATSTGDEIDAVAVLEPSLSYSINVPSGLSLIANQLDHGSNTLNEVFPNVPDGSVLLKRSNASSTWSSAYFSSVGGWTPSNLTLSPGEGAFFQSPASFTLTFTGMPHVPLLPVIVPNGATYLLSCQALQTARYSEIVSNVLDDGAMMFQWNGSGYTVATYDSGLGGWVDNAFNPIPEPTIPVGGAVWIAPAGGAPLDSPANPFQFYRGLLHQTVGNANAVLQSDTLEMSNIGSSGQDGVEIDARLGLNLVWNDITTTNPWPADTALEWRYVQRSGTAKTVVGLIRSQQGVGEIDLMADFTSLGVTNYNLSFYNQGSLVGRRSVNSNANGPTVLYAAAPGGGTGGNGGGSTDHHIYKLTTDIDGYARIVIGGKLWLVGTPDIDPIVPGSTFEYDMVTYGGTVGIVVPNIGIVDAVGITYSSPANVAASFNSIQLAGTNLPPFMFTDESINPFGIANHALGQATFSVGTNSLPTVGNIGSSGQDGVSFALGGAASAQIGLSATGTQLPAGATLSGQAVGTLNGVTNRPLQAITFTQTATNLAIAADFTPLGAASVNFQVLSNGVPVYSSSTNAARMVVYVDGMEVFGSWWLWGLDIDHIDIYWGSNITNLYNFSFPTGGGGSTTVLGDGLSFQAVNLANLVTDGLSAVNLTGANLPAFTINSEKFTQLPVQIQSTLTATNLVLTWPHGGMLQASPDLNTWTDLPTATSPYAAPLNAPQQFFRVRSN